MVDSTVPTCEEAADELRAFMRGHGIWVEGLHYLLSERELAISVRTLYRWLKNPSRGADRLKMLAIVLRVWSDVEAPVITEDYVSSER